MNSAGCIGTVRTRSLKGGRKTVDRLTAAAVGAMLANRNVGNDLDSGDI